MNRLHESRQTRTGWLVMFIIISFFVALSAFSNHARAGDLILSTGTSTRFAHDIGEAGNRSDLFSVKYAGERFGVRYDRSMRGDDDKNDGVTFDIYARPFGGIVLAGGLGYFDEPLRKLGRQANFHGMIGYEIPRVFGPAGVGAYYDHWSNGRRLFNRDLPNNPPRNTLSAGVFLPF